MSGVDIQRSCPTQTHPSRPRQPAGRGGPAPRGARRVERGQGSAGDAEAGGGQHDGGGRYPHRPARQVPPHVGLLGEQQLLMWWGKRLHHVVRPHHPYHDPLRHPCPRAAAAEGGWRWRRRGGPAVPGEATSVHF